MSEKQTFYFVRATEEGPELYSREAEYDDSHDKWVFEEYMIWQGEKRPVKSLPANNPYLFTDRGAAFDHFKRNTLAILSHYRAEAEFYEMNLRKLQEVKCDTTK